MRIKALSLIQKVILTLSYVIICNKLYHSKVELGIIDTIEKFKNYMKYIAQAIKKAKRRWNI